MTKKAILILSMMCILLLVGCSNNSSLIKECIDCCHNNPDFAQDYCEEFCESHINEGSASEGKSFVEMVCSKE
jgi:uncharacterized lipoprotein NlpE involved in copper resistance